MQEIGPTWKEQSKREGLGTNSDTRVMLHFSSWVLALLSNCIFSHD